MGSLVVRVPNPRERTHNRDNNRETRKDTHDQDCVVIVAVVDKN